LRVCFTGDGKGIERSVGEWRAMPLGDPDMSKSVGKQQETMRQIFYTDMQIEPSG